MVNSNLRYSVIVGEPVLVPPSTPTPHEFKNLSDIDDQEGFRFQIPVFQIYAADPKMNGRDPVTVVKNALSKLLVFYYPFAGRLREGGENRKLCVECTGEGVLFVEADADVTLREFGDALRPPFPCWEKLLVHVPHSDDVLNCPLLLIQVTRLRCGGFIMAVRLNHTMSDACGIAQFMISLGEIARGASSPTILPVWDRHLLSARNPPNVTQIHREYEEDDKNTTLMPLDDMAHKSFFFGPQELAAIRQHLPPELTNTATKFELITACLWKCRTLGLRLDLDEEVRCLCLFNARSKYNPPLPSGYYGNAFALPAVVTTSGKLCSSPLAYAVELIKRTKETVTDEYMRSVADLMVLKGRPHFTVVRTFLVSDVTRAGFSEVDLGWGKPVYGGPAKGGVGAIPGLASFYIPFKNSKGDVGTVIPVCLPAPAMELFEKELNKLLTLTSTVTSVNQAAAEAVQLPGRKIKMGEPFLILSAL